MSRESPGASKTHSLKSTSSLTRWLRRAAWGEHSLLVYNTTDEFLQVLVTYLEAGLSQNQACLWVVSALPLEEAKKALRKEVGGLSPYARKKQLLIVDHLDWYLAGGSFDEETILRELLKKEEEALARGFTGLRVAIDAAWAEKRDWPPLLQHEARLSRALAGRKVVALCAYPAQRLSLGELVDITNMHDILIAREGRVFRLTRPMSAGPGKLSRVELQRGHKQAKKQFNSYKSMVKSAHDAIFFKDLQSRYILANNKTFAVFGLSRKEAIGKNDYEIMPDKEEARKNIEDDQIVFKTGKPREIAKHMTGADGKEYWFEAIKVPQFDSNGKVIGLVGIAKDITEHKRAEEALRRSEQSLVEAQRVAHVGNWDWDIKNDELRWSDEIYRIFGLQPQELDATHDGFLNAVHPDDRGFVKKTVDEALHKKRPYNIDHRIILPNGEERIVHEQGQVSFDENNEPIRLVGTVQDITERKRVEEGLRKSEAKYRTLYETIIDGIAGGPMNGRIGECNQAFADMLGYTREELKNLTYQQLTPKRWHQMEARMVEEQILKRGYSDEYEKEYIRKDGTVFPISAKVWLVRDEDGKPQGMWGIVRDISERKRVEEKTRKHSEELAALHTVASSISGSLDLKEVARRSLEAVLKVIHLDGGSVYVFNEDHSALRIITHLGTGERAARKHKEIKAGSHHFIWRAAVEKKVLLSSSPSESRRVKQHKSVSKPTCSGVPIAVPLISQGKVRGVMVVGAPGKQNYTPDELDFLQAVASQVATAVENAQLFEKARTERDRAAALHEISQTITKTLNLKEVAKRSLKAVLKVVQLELGSVHVFDEDQSVLRLITYVGFPEEGARKHKEIKAGSHHFVWRAAAEKKISMPNSSRKTHPVKRSKSVPKLTCSGRPIALPLISKGKVRGVMVVGAPDRENYTPDELDFLQAVASQVARAIENAHLYQKAEQSVEELRALSTRITKLQEEERARIVNYLHTNLAQTLATAKMNLDLLSQQPNKNPAQLRKSLSSVILTIDEAIKETRGLMFDIRTPMLDDLGLLAAVRWYTKAFFERTGVKVKIEGNHSLKDLSENRRIMYFRIIQELLTNVAKHAAISKARLALARRDGMDLIVVRDSGVGFDPKSLRLSHSAVTGLGLVAIREMVSHNKGHLDIHSAPAKGTTVTVSIPTKEPASIG